MESFLIHDAITQIPIEAADFSMDNVLNTILHGIFPCNVPWKLMDISLKPTADRQLPLAELAFKERARIKEHRINQS